ncbi:unnamed protein product [Schistosoma mattheei]|uniref:Uncharacterized protein n=1 Tax=Schistosoma mattheei TaxID=31246 RepID=A0A3P7Y935_9TREM|nr:unnamed protein product [Schistosoma mattheei]
MYITSKINQINSRIHFCSEENYIITFLKITHTILKFTLY